jgi:outer membrane protein
LTLTQALTLARERNGTAKAAIYDEDAARARMKESFAAFLPTITPEYQYNSTREQFLTTIGSSFFQQEGASTLVNGSWTILDSGERDLLYRASGRALASQHFNTRQSLRTVLFDVTQQYYDTLRAQELQRVSDAQVDRAAEILKSTDLRIAVGDAAKVERLQANADLLNARVQVLTARNNTTNAVATLKATIGFDAHESLPPLQSDGEPVPLQTPLDTFALSQEGLLHRPDLIALRKNVESLRFTELHAQHLAGTTFNLSANYDQQITPVSLQNRTFLFTLSYPLFDGGLSREQAREAGANVKSAQETLVQAERSARAEIEAASAELQQNSERLAAAKAAQDAADENYKAAIDAQKAGANGLLDVLTAQVSLVTAESDYIQAVYDFKISETRIKLVTGRPMAGE